MFNRRFRKLSLGSIALASSVALAGGCDSGDKKADEAAKAGKADPKKSDQGKAEGVEAVAKGADTKAEADAKAEAEDHAKGEVVSEPTAPVIEEGELVTRAEKVGGLFQGMGPADVVKLLGPPAHKGEIEQEAATGDFVQTWSYEDKGLSITMAGSDAEGSGQTVSAISVDERYQGDLPWGLKIGSPRADVEKIYGEHFDKDFTDADLFVAGSIYGGSHYRFEGGKVVGLFIGAGAE